MKNIKRRITSFILLFALYSNNMMKAQTPFGDLRMKPDFKSNLSVVCITQLLLLGAYTVKIGYDMFNDDCIYDFENKKFKDFLWRRTFDFVLDLIPFITTPAFFIFFFTHEERLQDYSSRVLALEILIRSIKIPIWMIVDKHFNPYKTIGVAFGIISAFVIFTQSKQ